MLTIICNSNGGCKKRKHVSYNSSYFWFSLYHYQRVDTIKRQVDRKKRKAIRWWFVSIRHGRHVLSQCPEQRHSPPGNIKKYLLIPGEMLLFRALAKNMAPMTNADESPTNRLTLFWLNISLFIVSTLCHYAVNHMQWGGGGGQPRL